MRSAAPSRVSWGLSLCVLLHASAIQSQQNAPILHAVDEHYNHLASLRAHFVERYIGMGQTRVESGTLLLKKAGRMRWDYDRPTGKVFVFDGHVGWFYTPGDAQAQRIPAKQLDDLHTPLRFLLGHTRLTRELIGITVEAHAPCGQDAATAGRNCWTIAGVPKGMDDRVHRLSLRVASSGLILSMSLEERDGAKTEFEFADTVENIPAPDSDFQFVVPPGVVVVDGSKPI